MGMWLHTTWQSTCTEWKVYQRCSMPRWFAPATTGAGRLLSLFSPATGVESGGMCDCAYPSTGMVCAQGSVTVPIPPWQISRLADNGITALAKSCHGRMWAYNLWARTMLLETLTIRSETLLGLCDEEGSQCGQQISKTICFWQWVLFHRWTVTFCSLWNIFSMHDFLS